MTERSYHSAFDSMSLARSESSRFVMVSNVPAGVDYHDSTGT